MRPINTTEELRSVLDNIIVGPSCLDMGWKWLVSVVWQHDGDSIKGWLVSTTFQRLDRETGLKGEGRGREWYIKKGTTESGVVKTCFAACELNIKHELMEAFKYKGIRIFDPHHTVEDLSLAAKSKNTR